MLQLVMILDPANADLLALVFREMGGYAVRHTYDFDEGLGLIAAQRPDVILADLQPDGLNLLRTLKGEASTADIPVFLMALSYRPADFEMAKALGVAGLFVTPFQLEEMLNAFHAALTPPY